MEEIWKNVVGYEGLYEVSSFGRVRRCSSANRLHTDGILRPTLRAGYLKVRLSKEGKLKDKNIHRMVAESFIPNPSNCKYVNHIDECKTNNYVSNLEWCDASYNTNYGTCIDRRIETRKSNNKTSKPIRLTNVLSGEQHLYRNMTECACAHGTSRVQLRRYLRRDKLLFNLYKIEEV